MRRIGSEEWWRTVSSAAAPTLAVAVAAAVWWLAVDAGPLVDLQAYRDAAQTALGGRSPYVPALVPFVYPPAGLLLVLPAGLGAPLGTAAAAWTSASVAALARSVWLLTRRAWPDLPVPSLRQRACWLFAAACVLEPTLLTLAFGQVGLLLLWLTVEGMRDQPAGARRVWLVGVAAAAKLTSAVVLLGLAAAGRWRSVLWGVVGAVGATAAAALLSPAAFRDYVGGAWRLAADVNTRPDAQNHAVTNLVRLLGGPATYGWLLAALVLVVGVGVAAWSWRSGDELAGLATVLVTGLVVSPVSWGHHWVAMYPALVLLLRELRPRQRWGCWALLVTASLAAVTHVDVLGSLGEGVQRAGESWSLWTVLARDWYSAWGLAFLSWAAARAVRSPRASAAPAQAPTARVPSVR